MTNKQVFEKINVLFQEQCAKLLPQMVNQFMDESFEAQFVQGIQLKAEDEQDPSKGVQIKSGLQNLGAEQLSGGQRTLISIVLLVSVSHFQNDFIKSTNTAFQAAKVGGFAQTLLMDEVKSKFNNHDLLECLD